RYLQRVDLAMMSGATEGAGQSTGCRATRAALGLALEAGRLWPYTDPKHLPGADMKTLSEHLRYTTGHCRFGGLLLAVCDEGVAAILLGDEDGTMVADLQQRFPNATLEQDNGGLKQDMQALLTYVDHPLGRLQLQRPLAARGSEFQKKVWAE